jgi:hypothetical protein
VGGNGYDFLHSPLGHKFVRTGLRQALGKLLGGVSICPMPPNFWHAGIGWWILRTATFEIAIEFIHFLPPRWSEIHKTKPLTNFFDTKLLACAEGNIYYSLHEYQLLAGIFSGGVNKKPRSIASPHFPNTY